LDGDGLAVRPWLCIVMARGFIDCEGVLDEKKQTDGTQVRAIYRESHTWALLEMFKMKNGAIADVKATFFGAPYTSARRGPGAPIR
jgi:hypothetical protein